MNNIWKVEINADDCPVEMWGGNLTIDMKADYVNMDLWELLTGQSLHRVCKLSAGDEIYVAHTDTTYKLGDGYGDSSLVCNEIIYKPRKMVAEVDVLEEEKIVGYIFRVIK